MGVLGSVDGCLGRIVFSAIGAVFLGGGMLCLYWGGSEIVEAHAARNWATVDGRIVASRASGDITYEYEVDGRALQSKRVFIGEYKGIESRYIIHDAMAKEVDPSASVLEYRFPWTFLVLCLMGLGFLGGAWLCFRTKQGFSRVVAEVLDAS